MRCAITIYPIHTVSLIKLSFCGYSVNTGDDFANNLLPVSYNDYNCDQ